MGKREEAKKAAIKRIMTGLHCSEEEAEEVYAYDTLVEHEKFTTYDLTQEQQKVAKKYTTIGTRTPTTYVFKKRSRKENATKGGIIAELAEFLTNGTKFETTDIQITNKEREIALKICGEWYKVTLQYCRNMNKAESQ